MMPTLPKPMASREKVRRHRERMRALQIWVPDTRTAAFRVEAHEQSLALAGSPHADEEQAFIDAISSSDEA